MADYKVGDVVRLKSGGPEMTITKFRGSSKSVVACQWFNGKTKDSGWFDTDTLELA
ncbi:YodC family protein [Bacteroidota bacterium]